MATSRYRLKSVGTWTKRPRLAAWTFALLLSGCAADIETSSTAAARKAEQAKRSELLGDRIGAQIAVASATRNRRTTGIDD